MSFLPIAAAELIEFSSIGEDDESDLGIAENGKLVGFLEKSVSPFGKCHLPVDLVLYPLQLYSSPPHFKAFFLRSRDKKTEGDF